MSFLDWLTNHRSLRWMLLIVAGTLSFASLTMPFAIRPSSYPIQIGDVIGQDIQASQTLTYTSTLLTEQERKDAELGVSRIYLPADPSIARSQIDRFRITLNYIDTVRADTFSSQDQKLQDLAAVSNPAIPSALSTQILDLEDNRWDVVKQESLRVLEMVMRNSIRDDQISEAKRNIPTLVSFSFSPDQAAIVVGLVSEFITPNSLYSENLTQEAREQARNTIAPVERRFVAGQTIVTRGQIITPIIYESLEQFGLVKPQQNNKQLVASLVMVCLAAGFFVAYFWRKRPKLLSNMRQLIWVTVLFLVYLYAARLLIPNRAVIPYLFPLSAFGMTVASLVSIETALVFSLALSILSAYGLPLSLDLSIFYMLSSLIGVLILGKGRRLASFIWAGLAAGAGGAMVIVGYRLPDTITDWLGLATLMLASIGNGVASASITLLSQYLFSQMLGIPTALQLLEISRPDHPLLQYMLRYAPGSYQHSLQVANLAEQAAEAIGADPLLVRVGAIYHDVGKAANPLFFIENQVPGKLNPHDDLDPAISAATIIRHVADGVQLAKKHRLPLRIQDFIREHHGTLITRYQYAKAVSVSQDESQVDMEQYRYPGPRPQSKETALLMLADGCEARARADLPKDDSEVEALVKKVFDFLYKEGQLDDTTLTQKDLNVARQSFSNTLRNTYHPRIQYPEIRTLPPKPDTNASPSIVSLRTDDATDVLQPAAKKDLL